MKPTAVLQIFKWPTTEMHIHGALVSFAYKKSLSTAEDFFPEEGSPIFVGEDVRDQEGRAQPRKEAVHFDKITARLKKLSHGLSEKHCDSLHVAPKLARRIAVSNLQKNKKNSCSETFKDMYNHVNSRSGQKAPLVADDVYEIIMKNATLLDSEIIYDRDSNYDYFGFKTLERSCLLKIGGKVVERPQHMRVAVGIHKDTLKTYQLMPQCWFTHASPTLVNAGTRSPQLSNCFLICMKDDCIEGIYDTLEECAVISKSTGGIGVSVHNIRATGRYIRGANGTSNGIVPTLRVLNDTARYVDQGAGRRKGAFAVYLEPWHAYIFEFLDLRKNHGKEENRACDPFCALWVPDLFMKRVQNDETWSLFCPSEAPGLADCWGEEFEVLYTKYETKVISPTETAVCNLASMAPPHFVKSFFVCQFSEYDIFPLLFDQVTSIITSNLNKIFDVNCYPTETARTSNMRLAWMAGNLVADPAEVP
ncbi:hypothetical protein EJ110_NYTH10749 [Nymphaea thermarum]|nr:hypothetical protein EJ110_NYTH10749 [Nymphaea thermarum]